MGHHVIAVTEALLAQVANKGTIAVLKGRPLPRSRRRPNSRAGEFDGARSATNAGGGSTPSATELGLAQPALPLFALLLCQQDTLLFLPNTLRLLFPLLGLVLLGIGDAVDRLEVLLDLGLIPVAGQTQAARQTVVLVIQNLCTNNNIVASN
jgi:hypothetical protein